MGDFKMVYGLVSDNSKVGYARVKLPTYDDIVTDFLPVIKARAMNDDENWPFEINEQVACIVDDRCKTGIILGAISNDEDAPDADAAAGKYRKKFSDGTYIEYDKAAHKMSVALGDSSGEISAVVGSSTISVKDNLIKFNAGSNKGLVNISDLVTKLNNLESDNNDLKAVFTSWAPVPNDGGAALKAAVSSYASGTLTPTVVADLEDTKVKH